MADADAQTDDSYVPIMPDEAETDGKAEDTQTKETAPEDNKNQSEAKETEAKEAPQDQTVNEPAAQKDADKDKEKPQDEEQEKKEDSDKEQKPSDRDLAQRAFQQRQRTRQQVAQQLDQVYGPRSQEDLIQEGYSEADAKIEALRQEMLFRDQRNQIADLNAGLQVDASQVLNDFPVFNPESPDFDPDFAKEVEDLYRQAADLQADEQGIVLQAKQPLYDFYNRMYAMYSRGNSKGEQNGQKNAVKMLSRTETPSGASQTNSEDSEDPFLQGFAKGTNN